MKQAPHLSSCIRIAQQGGFMVSYWSALSLNTNDCTPEITSGSEGAGYA